MYNDVSSRHHGGTGHPQHAFANLRQFIQRCKYSILFPPCPDLTTTTLALVRIVPKRPAVPANTHTLPVELGLDTSWILGHIRFFCSTAVHTRTKTPAQTEYLTPWDGYPRLPSQYLTRPSGAINSLKPLTLSSQTRPPADALGDWSSNVLYPYAPRHRRQLLWGEHTPPIRSCSANILT
jgi:hypothetical protein